MLCSFPWFLAAKTDQGAAMWNKKVHVKNPVVFTGFHETLETLQGVCKKAFGFHKGFSEKPGVFRGFL